MVGLTFGAGIAVDADTWKLPNEVPMASVMLSVLLPSLKPPIWTQPAQGHKYKYAYQHGTRHRAAWRRPCGAGRCRRRWWKRARKGGPNRCRSHCTARAPPTGPRQSRCRRRSGLAARCGRRRKAGPGPEEWPSQTPGEPPPPPPWQRATAPRPGKARTTPGQHHEKGSAHQHPTNRGHQGEQSARRGGGTPEGG